MRTITALLIDDSQDALDLLEAKLKEYGRQVQIIGTAKSVVEAVKAINASQVDLLFLDVQLGDGTGFDVLELVKQRDFHVVFTTASDEHAIRAFQFAAIDYLLKPIQGAELERAVSRVEQLQMNQNGIEVLLKSWQKHDEVVQIALHTEDVIIIVSIADIIRCEGMNNYTIFHRKDEPKTIVSQTIKHYEKLLSDKGFFRCHQSHLINLRHLKKYIKQDGGEIVLSDGSRVPVSQRKRSQLLTYLKTRFR